MSNVLDFTCQDNTPPLQWGLLVEGELRFMYDEQRAAWDRACDLRSCGHVVQVVPVRLDTTP